jgi:toxin ParE1/3/4
VAASAALLQRGLPKFAKRSSALEQAYTHIGRHPASGSPRYTHELNLPGLRCWPLKHYLQLVFYVERTDHIDVWRVLHGQRDTPAWMGTPDEL